MSDYYDGKPRRGGGRILAFFFGLSLFVAVCGALFYFFVAKPAISPLDKIANALGTVTKAKVSITGSSVVLEKAETRELAVVQRKTQSIVKYETKWLLSDKMIIVKGNFMVKAGFDLTGFEGFELEGGKVVGNWPKAKVLSVELLNYEIYHSKGGVVNRLQGEDYEAVVNLLKNQARRDAEQSGDLLKDAEDVVRQRLEDISGQKVDLRGPVKAKK